MVVGGTGLEGRGQLVPHAGLRGHSREESKAAGHGCFLTSDLEGDQLELKLRMANLITEFSDSGGRGIQHTIRDDNNNNLAIFSEFCGKSGM